MKTPLINLQTAGLSFLCKAVVMQQIQKHEVREGKVSDTRLKLRCPDWDDFLRVVDYCLLARGPFVPWEQAKVTLRKVVQGRRIELEVHYIPENTNG